MSPIVDLRFGTLGIFNDAPHQAPNHVLVNEYQPGQGIMPHEDGAAYYPLVATVSLGAPIVLDMYHKHTQGDREEDEDGRNVAEIPSTNRRPQYRILQERRSLLIMRGKMYTDLLHGIEETTRDEDLGPHSICNWELLRETEPYQSGWYERKTRTSLTYRDVLHVVKMGNALKFLGGR
jgi:alkylated DNA repair protein alkB family protein 6